MFTVGLAASAARPARITGVQLSFHMSVARMVNCKLSGLLRATVPGGNQGVEGRGISEWIRNPIMPQPAGPVAASALSEAMIAS